MKLRVLLFAAAFCALPLFAAFPRLKLELVCEHQLDSPMAMVSARDGSGRMFICEQRGKIRIFRNGMLEPGVFLDIGAKLCAERAGYDERGLLGMAFHPGFANAVSPGFRRFYLFYVAPSPNAPGTPAAPVDSRQVLAEYRVSATNPDVANPNSERILISFDKPQFNNAGGGIEFGPDGMLYFSVGDGGSSNDNDAGHSGGSGARPPAALGNAQDLTKWLGKIHRIDPLGTGSANGQYGIPEDNPFFGSPGGELPEIFAYGLRNARRICFDSRPGGTDRLYCDDVGQGSVEEINLVIGSFNYGWRNREGSFDTSHSTGAPVLTGIVLDPLVQYAHPGVVIGSPPLSQYGTSVTGGRVYRGGAIPLLAGKYVFGDFSTSGGSPNGRLLGMEETAPEVFALANLDILGGNPVPYFIQGFGEDEAGELYVLGKKTLPVSAPNPATGLPSGSILKIVPVPPTTAATLGASKDNTIYEENEYSNGGGSSLISGSIQSFNNGSRRRALLAFDLSPIPAGATVATAALTLRMDRTVAPAYAFSLHAMAVSWGEGTVNADHQPGIGEAPGAGDATWQRPFFGQPATWATPGGDFASGASATQAVTGDGAYTWAAPQLAYDVNGWLAAPATNFGWMLKPDMESVSKSATGAAGSIIINVADAAGLIPGMPVTGGGIAPGAKIAPDGINQVTRNITLSVGNSSAVAGTVYFAVPSAKRFISRTGFPVENRPGLAVTYVPAPVASHRRTWELANYYIGEFISDTADTDKDGIVDGLEYAWGLNPKSQNVLGEGLTINAAGLASGNPIQITFRRDTLATDLTYQLQVSSDLIAWTTIVTSTAGAAPTGPGYLSETQLAPPFRAVLCTDTVPIAAKRFVRLKIIRL